MISSPDEISRVSTFLEISKNSQENVCARVSFLIKLQPSLLTEHLRKLLLAFPDMVLRNRAKQKLKAHSKVRDSVWQLKAL